MAKIHSRLVALAALVVPIVGVLAPRGFTATLLAATALIGGFYAREERFWPTFRPFPVILLVLLLGWGGLSALWSFSAVETLAATAKLAVLAAGGMVFITIAAGLRADERSRVRWAFVVGFVVSVILLASEEWTGGSLSQTLREMTGDNPFDDLAFLNMAACVSALTVWLAVIALAGWRRRYAPVIPIVAVALLLGPLDSLAAQTALVTSGGVFVVALRWQRAAFRGLRVAVFALMAFAPAAPHLLPAPDTILRVMPDLSYSIVHRIAIWQFSADRIVEKPLTGWGLESSRHFQERYGEAFPTQYRAADRNHAVEATLAYFKSQVLPLHPHNGFLQVWLELGAVGALALLAFLLWMLAGADRLSDCRCEQAGLAALLAGSLVVFLTAFGAWQSWWQAALWLVAGLAVAVSRWSASPWRS